MNDIIPMVRSLVAEALTVSPELISDSISYGDIPEWDSLGHMNIMMALEEKHAVPITSDSITKLTSIIKIAEYLMDKSNE